MNRNISIALIIAIVLTAFFLFTLKSFRSSTGPFPMDESYILPNNDTSFGGLFANPNNSLNDSLPHYQYRRLEDSLKNLFNMRQLENRSIGGGRDIGPIGLSEIEKESGAKPYDFKNDPKIKLLNDSINLLRQKWIQVKDSPDSLNALKKKEGDLFWELNVRENELLRKQQRNFDYYFALTGYNLQYENKFFIQNGTFNLAYVKWDTVIKRTYDSTKHGHYESKQIPVRYATENSKILIPISKQRYNFLNVCFEIGTYVWIFLLVYFSIGLPIQIVINISKGKAFNRKNIKRFKIIALAVFIYALIGTIAPYILRFFFRKMIPDEFTYQPFVNSVFNNLYLYLVAIVIFTVGLAFKRGYKLQQEQELTI